MHFLGKVYFVSNLKNGKCTSFILQILKCTSSLLASSNFSACEKVFPKKSELNRTVQTSICLKN